MAGVTSVPAQQSAQSPAKLDGAAMLTDVNEKNGAASLDTSVAPADQRKDKKQRRERLPLPDPIPTEAVKRYPEPSKADHQAEVEAEDAKLQACFDRLNSARAFFDERQKIRDAGKPAFETARKRFNELNEECRLLMEARKEITSKLKALKEQDIAARNASSSNSSELAGAGKDGNEALRSINTIEELDDRIEELQYRLETMSLPILQEKRLVAQISFLQHKGRDFIMSKDQSIKDEKAAKDVRISTRKELEDARTKQDSLIDSAKAKLEAQKKVLDGIRADQETEIKKLQEETSEIDRDAEKKKIGEIKAHIRKIREDYQVKLDEWYLNERIHYEQQKIAKRKRYEAVQAEREARRKAWEAEQAQYPEPDPYQEQKDMCAGLIVYLQTLLGETVEKTSVNLMPDKNGAPSLKTSSATREITAKGKAIGKSTVGAGDGFENLAFGDFVKKSGKSKGKKGRRSAAPAAVGTTDDSADAPLKPHSIDYIASFTELGIKPPLKMNEVRGALEQVKEKKVYYDNLPKPTEEERAKIAANKTKKQAIIAQETKPKQNGADIMNGDGNAAAFPGLLGGNEAGGSASAPVRDIAGPSFKAVASGAATAPPPTPAVSAADIPLVQGVGAGNMMEATMGVEAIVGEDAIGQSESLMVGADPALTEA